MASNAPSTVVHDGSIQPTAQQIEETTSTIRETLTKLRMDDMASLAEFQKHRWRPDTDSRLKWLPETIDNAVFYTHWLITTWFHVLTQVFKGIEFLDWISVVVFARGASVILAIIWLWVTVSTFPPLVFIYNLVTGSACTGISLVNAMNPPMFRSLTDQQLAAGKEKLAEVPDPNGHNPRTFSLDIAKVLLQISALMYERNEEDQKAEMQILQDHVKRPGLFHAFEDRDQGITTESPGRLFSMLVGDKHEEADVKRKFNQHAQHARTPVDKWCKKYEITYQPVSELYTLSQAYCSIFWDPKSNWMVVAFKGTDPRSFHEWTTDFTAQFVDYEDDIPGFHNGHKGFKERLFPSELPDNRRPPWETISKAIKVVSEQLTKFREPGAVCNVWFTGHSLGTALATLAYARALTCPDDIGPKALLRDAYLFATPITVDAPSRNAFNGVVYAEKAIPRTMWRVTNRNDFVATGLPALGDSDKYTLGRDNLFGFSHLGIEIFMKSGPQPCEVQGNIIMDPEAHYDIHITSKFTPEELIEQRKEAVDKHETVLKVFRLMQYIPIVGRLAAHAATNYYDQLDQIAIKGAVAREP